jgi:hypothetical protein
LLVARLVDAVEVPDAETSYPLTDEYSAIRIEFVRMVPVSVAVTVGVPAFVPLIANSHPVDVPFVTGPTRRDQLPVLTLSAHVAVALPVDVHHTHAKRASPCPTALPKATAAAVSVEAD